MPRVRIQIMPFNWNNIRTYNNSQNNAFEELVCQLAREEQIEHKESFLRIGTPDGGVEAYSVLENGDEYGWQAKFFHTLGTVQWKQLDKSFKTAITKHPNLVKYYICLPIDRADPRVEEQDWFMDKWNNQVTEWNKYAKGKGREIEFEYWGSSELIARLSKEEHSGRRYFWFNEVEFSTQWFADKIDRSIDALGSRYTPELNFELKIAKIFDGIAREQAFKNQFDFVIDDLLKKATKALSSLHDSRLKERKTEISHSLQKIEKAYSQIDFCEMVNIDFERLLSFSDALDEKVSSCESLIHDLEKKEKERASKTKHATDYESHKFISELHDLRELWRSIRELQDFFNSSTATLSILPNLILSGKAGIGKSHLIADIAKQRQERGLPSILLLGQHFATDENPWTQILRNLLRVPCNEDEFLGALDAKAQSVGSRIILFIDAINEGRGKYFWPDHIKGFIKSFEKYRWVGLVLSVRTSYEKLLVPKELVSNEIAVQETHYGFAEVEYEASKKFFENYEIQQPSIPLLHPEFQNPLFLKLFCEGLHKAGLSRIPEGHEGITRIIEFYLHTINERLSDPKRLDYPESINLVEKATKLIAQKKIEDKLRFLPYEDAYLLLEGELRKISKKGRFLDELISEGVFTKDIFWDKNKHQEGIHFAYERFEDHLTTSFLLEKHLDKSNPESSFSEGTPLFDLVKDESECSFNRGIIEALFVQIPELIGKELYELAPHCKSFFPVIESFVESLIWRKPETLSKRSKDYINKYVLRYSGTFNQFFETILLITSNPNHPFNADFLHQHLMKFSLPLRDAWWTPFINDRFGKFTAIDRLVEWAWSEEDKSHVSNDSIRLVAKTIAWFLTASNRYLRDQATKALVCLLENRVSVVLAILREFEGVNDPYVSERLYAVAYGCALRTRDTDSLKPLSEYVYGALFKNEYVYPHVLLRDYARGLIEYSIYLDLDIKIDQSKIRPPYRSNFPTEFPTEEEIDKYEFDYKSPDFKDYYWSQNQIISSMRGRPMGDFGRYVFRNALTNWRDLDHEMLTNLAIKQVFELGYDVEKHGKADRLISRDSSYTRDAAKPERIGKKYQWIAFYQLMAKISDNFQMDDPASWGENKKIQCEGPWEPYVRDIDPSLLIKKDNRERYEELTKHWWFNVSFGPWNTSHKVWLRDSDDLPNPIELIAVRDTQGLEWLVLESHPEWSEPSELGQEKWFSPRKSFWYLIRSFLVHQKDYQNWKKSFSTSRRHNHEMPMIVNRYELFSREYYWSPAWSFCKRPYYSGEEWRTAYDTERQTPIGKVIVTTESFLWEEEYDCAKEDTISFLKPAETIFNGLGLSYSAQEGDLLNVNGELICFDPSVNNRSLSCLLIRKKDFVDFLNERGLRIFWTVTGEKVIIGGKGNRDEYLGRLEIEGSYYLDEKSMVVGQSASEFR